MKVYVILSRTGQFVAAKRTEAEKNEFIRPFAPGHFLVKHVAV